MIHPRNLVLGVLVIAVVGVRMLLRAPALEELVDAPLLPRVSRDNVARVLVEHTPEGGELQRVSVVRRGEGWIVSELQDFPAQAWLVEQLIDRVGALRTTSQVAREASSWEELGVGEDALRLRFEDESGVPVASLRLGRPVQSQASAERVPHLRLEGRDAVYRAPGVPWVEPEPARWMRTALFELTPESVTGLGLVSAVAQVEPWRAEYARGESGAWTSDSGARAPRTAMRRLVDQLCGLQAARLESEPGELRQGEWTELTLRGLNERAEALVIGPPLPDGGRLAARASWLADRRPWRVRLDAALGEELVARARELVNP